MEANLERFFSDIGIEKTVDDDITAKLAYLCCEEFGWTQKDFEDVELPFLFNMLAVRHKVREKQEEENKRRGRRG